jgi:hypothetical protein
MNITTVMMISNAVEWLVFLLHIQEVPFQITDRMSLSGQSSHAATSVLPANDDTVLLAGNERFLPHTFHVVIQKSFYHSTVNTNVVVEWLKLLLRIQKFPGSNLTP